MKIQLLVVVLSAALLDVALSSSSSYRPQYSDAPPSYNFNYAVRDDYNSLNYGANEARKGLATKGEYRVALPDGRIQTVKYSVSDAYSGYMADVSYSGKPRYEPYKPQRSPHYKSA